MCVLAQGPSEHVICTGWAAIPFTTSLVTAKEVSKIWLPQCFGRSGSRLTCACRFRTSAPSRAARRVVVTLAGCFVRYSSASVHHPAASFIFLPYHSTPRCTTRRCVGVVASLECDRDGRPLATVPPHVCLSVMPRSLIRLWLGRSVSQAYVLLLSVAESLTCNDLLCGVLASGCGA